MKCFLTAQQGLNAIKKLSVQKLLPVLQANQISGAGLLIEVEGFSNSNKAQDPATATPDAGAVVSCDGLHGVSIKGTSACH